MPSIDVVNRKPAPPRTRETGPKELPVARRKVQISTPTSFNSSTPRQDRQKPRRLGKALGHGHLAWLGVPFEAGRAATVFAWLAGREISDEQRFAGLDLDADLVAALQAVQKRRRGDDAGVVVELDELVVV